MGSYLALLVVLVNVLFPVVGRGYFCAVCGANGQLSEGSLLRWFPALQPEQIRQCLLDYASINVWALDGGETDTPGILLA